MKKTSFTLVITLILCTIFIYIVWFYPNVKRHDDKPKQEKRDEFYQCIEPKEGNFSFWQNFNYVPIPKMFLEDARHALIETHTINLDGVDLYYKESKPLKQKDTISVLLLHGSAFSAVTWENLGTLHLISSFGYRAVAIDLPGFGKSQSYVFPRKNDFLLKVIVALKIQNSVIISPSISGLFSLPYVFKYWKNMSGFIPISPVIPSSLPKINCDKKYPIYEKITDDNCMKLLKSGDYKAFEDISCIMIPVMIIYGENDKSTSSVEMCQFPLSKVFAIPHGSHAVYLSNPSTWHELLYNFLFHVSIVQKCR